MCRPASSLIKSGASLQTCRVWKLCRLPNLAASQPRGAPPGGAATAANLLTHDSLSVFVGRSAAQAAAACRRRSTLAHARSCFARWRASQASDLYDAMNVGIHQSGARAIPYCGSGAPLAVRARGRTGRQPRARAPFEPHTPLRHCSCAGQAQSSPSRLERPRTAQGARDRRVVKAPTWPPSPAGHSCTGLRCPRRRSEADENPGHVVRASRWAETPLPTTQPPRPLDGTTRRTTTNLDHHRECGGGLSAVHGHLCPATTRRWPLPGARHAQRKPRGGPLARVCLRVSASPRTWVQQAQAPVPPSTFRRGGGYCGDVYKKGDGHRHGSTG